MSRWETTSTRQGAASPAAVWGGSVARIDFKTGLRLRFRVVEFEQGRLFTDEARLPGARMVPLWRRVMGPRAAKALPAAQQAVVELASA